MMILTPVVLMLRTYQHVSLISLLIILVLTTLSSGCATVFTQNSVAKRAPSERMLGLQTHLNNAATLTVVRHEGAISNACFYALSINKKLVARLDLDEYAQFFLPPGKHTVEIDRDPQGNFLCEGGAGTNARQWEVDLSANDEKVYHFAVGSDGKITLQAAK